jgi:hypothetical protein
MGCAVSWNCLTSLWPQVAVLLRRRIRLLWHPLPFISDLQPACLRMMVCRLVSFLPTLFGLRSSWLRLRIGIGEKPRRAGVMRPAG